MARLIGGSDDVLFAGRQIQVSVPKGADYSEFETKPETTPSFTTGTFSLAI